MATSCNTPGPEGTSVANVGFTSDDAWPAYSLVVLVSPGSCASDGATAQWTTPAPTTSSTPRTAATAPNTRRISSTHLGRHPSWTTWKPRHQRRRSLRLSRTSQKASVVDHAADDEAGRDEKPDDHDGEVRPARDAIGEERLAVVLGVAARQPHRHPVRSGVRLVRLIGQRVLAALVGVRDEACAALAIHVDAGPLHTGRRRDAEPQHERPDDDAHSGRTERPLQPVPPPVVAVHAPDGVTRR